MDANNAATLMRENQNDEMCSEANLDVKLGSILWSRAPLQYDVDEMPKDLSLSSTRTGSFISNYLRNLSDANSIPSSTIFPANPTHLEVKALPTTTKESKPPVLLKVAKDGSCEVEVDGRSH